MQERSALKFLICFPLTFNILRCSVKVEFHTCIYLCVSLNCSAFLTYSRRAIWSPVLLLRFFFGASGISLNIDHPLCLPDGLEEVGTYDK